MAQRRFCLSMKELSLDASTTADRTQGKPKAAPATLASLTDVPTRTILGKVPLFQLIRHVPRVNRQWSKLQRSVLAAKRHLVLYIGKNVGNTLMADHHPYQMNISHAEELVDAKGQLLYPSFNHDVNRLELSSLTADTANKLINLMPNISAFEIALYVVPIDTTDQVIRLIEHWKPNLKTFKVHCQFNSYDDFGETEPTNRPAISAALLRLVEVVNSLPILEHLTLNFHEELRPSRPLELSILGRLKEFYFDSSDDAPQFLYNSLDRYAERSDQLQKIGLGNRWKIPVFCERFRNSNLKKKFVALPGVDMQFGDQLDVDLYDRFLATFIGLEMYNIGESQLRQSTITCFQQTLSPLTNLVHIHWVMLPSILYDPPATIGSLPSVKVLTIQCDTVRHDQLAFPHWGKLFPSLQIIVAFHSMVHSCAYCRPNQFEFEDEDGNYIDEPADILRVMRPCARLLLRPFKQCPQLQKIYYCFDYMEELIIFKREDL